jgi:hypothetical protein
MVVHLIGVHLMGVHLISVHLMGVNLIGIHYEGVGSGRQHRAKVEGAHRTMCLVRQTPPFGVRCGDPRNERQRERMNDSWLLVWQSPGLW